MLLLDIQSLNFPQEIKEKLKDSVSPKVLAIKKTKDLYEELDEEIQEDCSTIESLQDKIDEIETNLEEKREKREALEEELEMLNKNLEKHLSENIDKLAFWLFLGSDSSIVSSIIYGPDTLTLELFS